MNARSESNPGATPTVALPSLPHHPDKAALLLTTLLLLGMLALGSAARAAGITLIQAGAVWKYLDNGSNQGTTWRQPGFDDSTWASGPAQLGYGGDGETTTVGYGPDPNNKYITTYFRHTFDVSAAASFAGLTFDLLRDDGIVVYLNGVEVHRSNMPTSTVAHNTLANVTVSNPTWFQASAPASALVEGVNVLAVEIHQAAVTSSDISLNLALTGNTTATVTRGPYLQTGTPSSLIVRWRTDAATDSVVRYGTDPANLNLSASDPASTTEHTVTLSGLTANTRYYYSVGSTAATLAGGTDHFFYTAPPANSAQAVRIWVLGDSGTADSNATAVRNAYYALDPTRYTDLILMLGDNAYNNGTDAEYQAAVFDMYPTVLRQTVLWSTLGNHDAALSTPPYFDIFSLPTGAQAGGIASGTEKYYSFNFANIHFVCLDSMSSSRAVGGAMHTWLANDLAANQATWLIAFWHHPPYTKGSHNSDSEQALIDMRANFLPLLEDYGVDLVLTGHSHSYERSYLIDGHYGASTTFSAAHVVDGGDGRQDGTGAYQKPVAGPSAHAGAVYAVAGSSGKISGGTLNHPAMLVSLNELGSMVLDVDTAHLDARFLRSDGAVRDTFTLVKGPQGNLPPSVSLTTPTEGSTFLQPTAINLTAIALDTDGTVTQVDFYAGATWIGSANTSPYTATWSGAPAGDHTLTAVATDDLGANGASTPVQITVYLPTPGGLSATAVSPTRIDLAWSDISGETGYAIERKVGTGAFNPIATTGADATAYSDTTVQADTTYTYRIWGFTPTGTSLYSNEASTTTPLAPPTAPTGLTALPGNAQVTLSWNPSAGATSYSVYRRDNTTAPYSLLAPDVAGTTYVDAGLVNESTYYYVATATGPGGESPASSEVSARPEARAFVDTFANLDLPVAGTVTGTHLEILAADGSAQILTEQESGGQPQRRRSFLEHRWQFPAVPSGLSITLNAIAWAPPNSEGDDFAFEVSRDGGQSWARLFTVLNGTAAGTGHGAALANGTGGSLLVRVVDTDSTQGNRALDAVHVDHLYLRTELDPLDFPPAAPTGLSASPLSATSVQLSWTDGSVNEQGFRILRSTDNATFAEIAVAAPDTEDYTDATASPNTTYWYKVRAFTPSHFADSNVATAVTPDGISLSATGSKQKGLIVVNLTWSGGGSVPLVDLWRRVNGGGWVKIQSNLPNSGSGQTTDNTGLKGAQVLDYQICSPSVSPDQAEVSSNTVTLVF